jgi:RNA polymerase sigma-70 factor, ECF subfamily
MSMARTTPAGDRGPSEWAAFEAEALPHLEGLFRIAMWFERDRAAAEDLVQETFVEALRSFHRFERGTNCRAWLIAIMRHLEGKRWRVRSRVRTISDGEIDLEGTIPFEPPTPQNLTDEGVRRALEALPRVFQEVLLLADVEELRYKEIAATLQVPVGTVMSRLHRARQMLRRELTENTDTARSRRNAAEEDVG